ncbi:MAG: rod-binding protein [Planctomycetaceae bacterium]|nr:rod-binding protein [Planctomycetaceae bacterium]
MNTNSWIPNRATAMPVQYLASLNELSAMSPAAPGGSAPADPVFLNRLKMSAAGQLTLPTPGGALDTPSPATASDNQASAVGKGLWESLRGLGPVGLKLEQRPSAFEVDSEKVAEEQLQSRPESAKQAMQQFVGETFYGMLMKQMRNTVVQSDLYGNSSAKRMFESQLDQTLVQELATNHSEFLSRPIRI